VSSSDMHLMKPSTSLGSVCNYDPHLEDVSPSVFLNTELFILNFLRWPVRVPAAFGLSIIPGITCIHVVNIEGRTL